MFFFFLGGGSWLNMIGAGLDKVPHLPRWVLIFDLRPHDFHESRTRTLNSPWRTIGRSGVIAVGWSCNDKGAGPVRLGVSECMKHTFILKIER